MPEGINVLSLFDGMSCGMIALERSGIKVNNYYASEIDKYAIKVSQSNYPEIVRVGDVTKISYKDGTLSTEFGNFQVGKVDLLIGGSPCQSISNLGNGLGLDGKSGLFYHYLRLKDEIQPTKFVLENVVGNKKAIDIISEQVNQLQILIDSNLVSGANRKRYYWTDIEGVEQPPNKHIMLKDILTDSDDKSKSLSDGRLKWLMSEKGQATVKKKYASIDPIKAGCLTARSDASWNCNYVTRNGVLTKLSCEEYEILQTVPVGYTSCVSDSQRYKMLGNGWTVDVISHIFNNLKENTDATV
jgi:site-specific DNA-cytosine methylase